MATNAAVDIGVGIIVKKLLFVKEKKIQSLVSIRKTSKTLIEMVEKTQII